MGVSLPEYEALCAASAKFITDEKFGAPQLENVMETVFGPYAGRQGNPEAETWKKYWMDLELATEPESVIPKPSLPHAPVAPRASPATPTASQPVDGNALAALGNSTPLAESKNKAQRNGERETRRKNNISTREKNSTGAPQNDLCNRLVIHSKELNSKKVATWVYYCIGCDHRSTNNSTARCYPHAKNCTTLARDWPELFQEVIDTLAGKVYSAVAASKLTGYSTAKRNGLTGHHLIEMIQLQHHWTYGLNKPEYTHSAKLDLPKSDRKYEVIEKPTPTLADLLNPVLGDEDLLFNHPDPYGVGALDSDDEEVDVPQVVRRTGLRLEIEDLIDLSNANLLARYNGNPKEHAAPAQVKKKAAEEAWEQDKANWDVDMMMY
ncbi:hypothetical protein C8J56DRAFT_1158345 [Mycena floridula]|nr:hypothetical protein C8J56DRAFT_1158345 [Mycena floridula]